MVLSAKVLWPLFPLLLLVVVVCLTWSLVHAVRCSNDRTAMWLQAAALTAYVLAAVSAMASEHKAMSAHVHRPFSFLAQLLIAAAVIRAWRKDRPLVRLNLTAWAAILSDTALHYLLRH
jgi:hypothetical protein